MIFLNRSCAAAQLKAAPIRDDYGSKYTPTSKFQTTVRGSGSFSATDIEPKALGFIAASAHANGVARVLHTAAWDWNEKPPPGVGGPFDVVLAGDVIYQDEHAPRLGQLLCGVSQLLGKQDRGGEEECCWPWSSCH